MSWTLHPINSSGQLDAVLEAIERARVRIETVVAPRTLDVVVQAWPGQVIERFGFVGYAPTADMFQLTVDPANPNLAGHLGEPFERMVAHEYHHTLRWIAPGYGRTLGEALVSEGLAGHFARELYDNPPEHYESALEPVAFEELAPLALIHWDDAGYDHPRWFFGARDLPRHAGYTLGHALVGEHLDARAGRSAAGLVHEPASSFLPSLQGLAARAAAVADTKGRDRFELRRHLDGLVYRFDRRHRQDGTVGYVRSDADLWIVRDPELGWVAVDESTEDPSHRITGRPWNVPAGVQGEAPPEGIWVSRKHDESYVYSLVYLD